MSKNANIQVNGQAIRRRREELNMTQAELAEAVGYKSRASINKIELGEAGASPQKLRRILEALQLSVGDLININISAEETEQGREAGELLENTLKSSQQYAAFPPGMNCMKAGESWNVVGRVELPKTMSKIHAQVIAEIASNLPSLCLEDLQQILDATQPGKKP